MKYILRLKEELEEDFGKDCLNDVNVKILLDIYEGIYEMNENIRKIYSEI